jgi:hypothetical protein
LVVGAIDIRLFLFARTLCLPLVVRFLGDAFFTGEAGSLEPMFSDASKISDGSIDSLARVRRILVPVRGVGGSSTVLRREARVVRAGAGVNSSSLSLFVSGVWSSSSDSSIIFLLEAALLEGRVGDAVDIFEMLLRILRWMRSLCRGCCSLFILVNNAPHQL